MLDIKDKRIIIFIVSLLALIGVLIGLYTVINYKDQEEKEEINKDIILNDEKEEVSIFKEKDEETIEEDNKLYNNYLKDTSKDFEIDETAGLKNTSIELANKKEKNKNLIKENKKENLRLNKLKTKKVKVFKPKKQIQKITDPYEIFSQELKKKYEKEKNDIKNVDKIVDIVKNTIKDRIIKVETIQEIEVSNGSSIKVRIIESNDPRIKVGKIFYARIVFNSNNRLSVIINQYPKINLRDINDRLKGIAVNENQLKQDLDKTNDNITNSISRTINIPYISTLPNNLINLAKRKKIKILIHKNHKLYAQYKY